MPAEDPGSSHIPAHLRVADVSIQLHRTRMEGPGRARRRSARSTIASIPEALLADLVLRREPEYFTSPLIAEAIAQRLGEADGPEIVPT